MDNNENKSLNGLNNSVDNYELSHQIHQSNYRILNLLRMQEEERRLKIRTVRSDIDKNAKNAVLNSIVCGAGSLAVLAFGSLAVQKLGLDNSLLTQLQQNHQSMLENANDTYVGLEQNIEYLKDYITTVLGPLNQYLTLDNAKEFMKEFGAVGSIAGLISAVSAKHAVKNINEWSNKNRELDLMREIMPNDVYREKKAFSEFSLYLMKQNLINGMGQFFDVIKDNFGSLKKLIHETNKKNKLNAISENVIQAEEMKDNGRSI